MDSNTVVAFVFYNDKSGINGLSYIKAQVLTSTSSILTTKCRWRVTAITWAILFVRVNPNLKL